MVEEEKALGAKTALHNSYFPCLELMLNIYLSLSIIQFASQSDKNDFLKCSSLLNCIIFPEKRNGKSC
jgi:hypothetical protein